MWIVTRQNLYRNPKLIQKQKNQGTLQKKIEDFLVEQFKEYAIQPGGSIPLNFRPMLHPKD